ncbi:MAG: prepilin-type N-terminal cleavage/methylation domain-containing protein [Rickettsiales bacterium]|nr:prepilin-type N-terminal cleavage/methylation domain-containing protein [Rickettsiales bacterium]
MKHYLGFTLLEMAIVILVISLLIGGVMLGSDLLRSSRILKIALQVDEFSKSSEIFRDKYKELPGDLSTATTFWGAETSCPIAFTPAARRQTCNGNGNGHIGDFFTDGGATSEESYRAWQHLANAGMLNGAYNGSSGAGSSSHALPGVNVPRGAIKGTGFTLMYIHLPAGNASYWPRVYGHAIIYGGTTATGTTTGSVLTPKEAFVIDQKFDDANPAYGIVLSHKTPVSPNCVTNDVAATTSYRFSYATEACSLIFITGF